MKYLLYLLFIIFIYSCKSPEHKLKDDFIENSKQVIKDLSDNKQISDLKIDKIDTINEKRELLMVSAILKERALSSDNPNDSSNRTDLLYKKSFEFENLANANKAKKIIGYSVDFSFKTKDKYNMVEFQKLSFPFYNNGELMSLFGYKERLLEKYHVLYLIK